MKNREIYQGMMEAQFSEWGAELDKLKSRADKAAAETRQGYYNEIKTLQTKQASIQAKLHEMRTSSDDAWEDLKEGLDNSWNQVKDSFDKAAARFK